MGPFAAIRAHHPDARITLLTTRPFADFARQSPYFDDVWIDEKPPLWRFWDWLALGRRLRLGRFERVYDLQTSDRSSWYFRLMDRPQWSGIARGCALPHANPARDSMHTVERQAEQLAMAGIDRVPPPDLSWVEADIVRFDLPQPFALLAVGGAVHRPAKRWPADRFAELAARLAAQGVTPVLLGTAAEAGQINVVKARCSQAVDLSGRTSFADIAALGRAARMAVGNDTGPMHLIAAAGCRSVVLFSAESDPALCAPRGLVTVVRRDRLAELPVDEVEAALGLALT